MARSFNGSSDSIVVPSAFIPLTAGTLSLWSYPNFGPTDANTQFFQDSDTARHAIFHNGTANAISMFNDGFETDFNASWTANTWNHFLFVWNKSGPSQKCYLNGAAMTVLGTSGGWGSDPVGTNVYIGRRFSTNGTDFYGGRLSQLAWWNVVDLTQAEINALVAGESPLTIRPQSLVNFLPLRGISSPEEEVSGSWCFGALSGTGFADDPPFLAESDDENLFPAINVAAFVPRFQLASFDTPPPSRADAIGY